MHKPPAFQFYAKDFLTGTMDLSLLEIGAYIVFLSWSWDNGPLPLMEAKRARILSLSLASFRKHWPHIAGKWIEMPHGYVNQRLEHQRDALAAFSAQQAERGRRSGEARKRTVAPTEREPDANHRSSMVPTEREPDANSSVCSLQSASADQEPLRKERGEMRALGAKESPHDAGFLMRFWPIYPRKTAKFEALKAWRKLAPDLATIDAMLVALSWQCRQPRWLEDRGEFIPHPATWLNQRRWEDEPVGSSTERPKVGSPEYHAKASDWFEDCRARHQGVCESSSRHRIKLALDATAEVEKPPT